MRTYAIGDIHGHLDKLKSVHTFIEEDRRQQGDTDAPIVHVGDYADRGTDTAGVLEYLSQGQAEGKPWIYLKGNHDRMMAGFLSDPKFVEPVKPQVFWLADNVGGRETLASYNVDPAIDRDVAEIHADAVAKVPASHRAFLENGLASYQRGGVFFCHAGIRPGVALDQQVEDDLLWIRQEFHSSDADHGALIVHGHTPVREVTHYGNRVNIDTGAAFGRELSAVVIEGQDVFQITASGRAPILNHNSDWL